MTDGQDSMIYARLCLLHEARRWRAEHGGTLRDSDTAFAAAYRAGEVELPIGIRGLVRSFGWRTLARWRRQLRAGGSAGLKLRYGNRRGTAQLDADAELRGFVLSQVAARPTHVSRARIIAAVRARFPRERCPSYRALQRWLAKWQAVEKNARTLALWANPDAHRSKYLPAFGDAAAGIDGANVLWEIDASPADIICTDGRFKRYASVDIGTRRARVVVVAQPSAEAVAALLRRALLDWGVPEVVRTDRGPDFTAARIVRALADLGIVHDVCAPDMPQQKPHVESFLRTLSREVDELCPGFAGHSVPEQVAIRGQKSHAARRGEDVRETFNVALSSADYQRLCDRWVEDVYHRRPHPGLGGRTPWLAAAGAPIRVIADERALDVLLAPAPGGDGWRTVTKKGVPCHATFFIAPELGGLVGERVQVRDDIFDAGAVYIFDAAGAYLCRAIAPEIAGIDPRDLALAAARHARAADAEGRAYARDLKREFRPENALYEILDAARAQAETGHAAVVPFRAPSSAHTTAALDAAAEAAAAPRTPGEPTPEERDLVEDVWAHLDAQRAATGTDDDAPALTAEQLARVKWFTP